jgi:general secretion pathway protein G
MDTQRKTHEDGFTFIETIIVMGIILILSSSVGFMAVKYLDKAKIVSAKSQIEAFSLALDSFFLDCGKYPAEDQGLEALWTKPSAGAEGWSGPYVAKPIPKDSWGNEYEYIVPGSNGLPYGIRSFGFDGAEGGTDKDADITSWE